MLYFAYGSNLNLTQMKKRCLDSVPVAKVQLKGYKLVFNRVADIIESTNDVVYGAIYEVSDKDIKNLDNYEGFPRLYTKIKVEVEDDAGDMYKAFVYIMVVKGRGEAAESYYNIIKQGFKDWDLPIQSLINARDNLLFLQHINKEL
jgi:gamma-glutamylcyclotransferase (GGCT)/AIG2-like uncharacterized protein YtfP